MSSSSAAATTTAWPSGAQFVNTLSPVIQAYDPNGNLVASGTTSLSFTASTSGNYAVRVLGANNTQGEYNLQVTDPPGTTRAGLIRSPAGRSLAPVQPNGTSGGS